MSRSNTTTSTTRLRRSTQSAFHPRHGSGVGIEKGDPAAERSFECASASAPVLAMLVGVVNPDGSVSGAEVAQKMVYTHLVDLVPMKESPCVVDPTAARKSLSHRALRSFIEVGFDLRKFGVPSGARCALLIPNSPELCVCLLACMNAYCAAPINPFSTPHEILSDCLSVNARCIVVMEGESVEGALLAAHEVRIPCLVLHKNKETCGVFSLQIHPESPACEQDCTHTTPLLQQSSKANHVLVLHTAGTSGSKKLVPYTLETLCTGCGCIIKSWNLGPGDMNLNMMPLFHIGGVVRNLCAPILSGGCTIPCSGFDAVLFWELLESMHFTWYYAAPTMHMAILHEAQRRIEQGQSIASASSVRMIANAAGGLLPVLAEQLVETFGAVVLPSYGMTECMPIASPPCTYKLEKPGSSGVPVGPEVCTFSEDGIPLRPNEVGEICIRGPPCFSGYENNPESNSQSFLPGGWFKTGDCGFLDEGNYLYITGRSKEIINRGGETISPMEIEQVVVQHPLVLKTIAFSVPHDQLQESVGVVVVPYPNKPYPDLRSLCIFCEDKLHTSKWPQVLVFMNDLPLTVTNKAQRIKLADRLALAPISDTTLSWNRTFQAVCPPKGSSLTDPITCYSITLDVTAVEKRLCRDLMHGVKSAVVFPIQLGPDVALVACVTPEGVDTQLLAKLCEEELHAYLAPRCVLAMSELPMRPKTAFVSESNVLYRGALSLSCSIGDTVVILHKEQTRWYCECNGTKGWMNTTDVSGGEKCIEGMIIDTNTLQLLVVEEMNNRDFVPVADEVEAAVERLWRQNLGVGTALSASANFFRVGGDSLKAGQLISSIRKMSGVFLTVAELFSNPTIRGVSNIIKERAVTDSMARMVASVTNGDSFHTKPTRMPESYASTSETDYQSPYSQLSPMVLFIQALPLFVIAPWKRITRWFVFICFWLYLIDRVASKLQALVAALLITTMLVGTVSPLFVICAKWIIVGRYRVGRYPLWGHMYLRVWTVEQLNLIFGRGIFEMDVPFFGQLLLRTYYRLMGASIGKNVKLHRRAHLSMYDLVTIGDNACIDAASLRPLALEAGYFVLLPIVVGANSSVGLKSTVVPGTSVPPDTHLGAQTSTYELREATKDNKRLNTQTFPSPPLYLTLFIGVPILIGVLIASRLPWLYSLNWMLKTAKRGGWLVGRTNTVAKALQWWSTPERLCFLFFVRWNRRIAVALVSFALAVLIKRVLIRKFREGIRTEPWDLFRFWLMSKLIPDGKFCGLTSILGSHYEPVSWMYRSLGAKIGQKVYWPGSGVDGIIAYDLFEVGDDVTFGSRSFVSVATSSSLARVRIGDGAMLADRCVVQPGVTIGKLAIMGSGSLAKEGCSYPVGSVWVGSKDNAAVMLFPEDKRVQNSSTITPFGKAFYLRMASYFVLPLPTVVVYNFLAATLKVITETTPLVVTLAVTKEVDESTRISRSATESNAGCVYLVLVAVALMTNIAMVIATLAYELMLKRYTVGRRRQGEYPWDKSSYCQRWQIYLSFDPRNFLGERTGVLELIQGSAYLVWYFRALGCTIGTNVCLYPLGADPMMTEPELITLGDHCSIDNSSLIAHINTRGVFALNPVHVGASSAIRQHSRLVSGARVNSHAIVLEHTLVMNGEEVEDKCVLQGWPCQSTMTLQEYESKRDLMLVHRGGLARRDDEEM